MKNISSTGLELIMRFEGLRLEAYNATADERRRGIFTIGYGATRWPNGDKVKEGEKLDSKEDAVDLLMDTVQPYVEAVNSYVEAKLNQNQFDALVSFVYNVGAGAFRSSTLLKLLNNGDYVGAAGQFGRWNKQSGKVLTGLTIRREAERELFQKSPGGCCR